MTTPTTPAELVEQRTEPAPRPVPPSAKKKAKKARDRERREQHARRSDAKGLPVSLTIPFDGIDYTVTRAAASDVELYELLEDDKYVSALRGFLGAEQWNRFKDTHRDTDGRVPMDDLERFLQKLMDRVGAGSGNS